MTGVVSSPRPGQAPDCESRAATPGQAEGSVVHDVPAGVRELVLPRGPPNLEIRGAPDLELLDLSDAGRVDRLRLVGCPRLALVRLGRDRPTLLSIDRPDCTVPLRFNGLVWLAEATLGAEVIGLPESEKVRRFCRDAWVGSAEAVPMDVELIACVGPGSLAAIADHRRASVRLAVADGESAMLSIPGPVDLLALVLVQACPRLALIRVTPEVLCVSVRRCHGLWCVAASGFSVRITDCHPTSALISPGSVRIAGPWREACLMNVGYTQVDGTAERFLVTDAPSLELITNWTDANVVVRGDCGRAVSGRQQAYPDRLQTAVRVAVGLHPTPSTTGLRVFARLPDIAGIRVALSALVGLLPERPGVPIVWRIRNTLLARAHELLGSDADSSQLGRRLRASWPERNSPAATAAWQADLAIFEACLGWLAEPRLGGATSAAAPSGATSSGAPTSGATISRAGASGCLEALGDIRHLWLVRMLLQARAERIASGRAHAWADHALATVFRCTEPPDEYEIFRFVPQPVRAQWTSSSAAEDGPPIVAYLIAGRDVDGGEVLLGQCATWLHNAGRREGGLEMLACLARSGNATALETLAEVPGGGGIWLPGDRRRALKLVLAAVHPRSA